MRAITVPERAPLIKEATVMRAEPFDRQPRIGLSLSGGGFRAASFHLGVLKRLDELAVLPTLVIMSCISGGAIAGALYALRRQQHEKVVGANAGDGEAAPYSVDQLIAELRPVLTRNLRGRALFGTYWRAVRTVVSLVWPRVSRTGMIADELDRSLFRGASLNELPPWILVNATNLRTGKAWKFFSDKAGDYIVGATDKTASIRIADAVAASAAYPGLADAYRFGCSSGELRPELLDSRWGFSGDAAIRAGAGWRARFDTSGKNAIMPLVDGGAYDNEGFIGLRSAGVTHAVLSSTAPPEDDAIVGWWPLQVFRMVEVIHARLGAATRQLAHEITHAVDPAAAGRELRNIGQALRALSERIRRDGNSAYDEELSALAIRVEQQADVGEPQRGHQFVASAPILLNKTEVARNQFAGASGVGLHIPQHSRGCREEIVHELARVRTDLDALEPEIVDLLMAQGYFLADAYCKLCMPAVIKRLTNIDDLCDKQLAPQWAVARMRVEAANSDLSGTIRLLRGAQRPLPGAHSRFGAESHSSLLAIISGRSDSSEDSDGLRFHLIAAIVPIVIALAAASSWLIYGLYRVITWTLSHVA